MMKHEKIQYSAFVMTFKRVHILSDTIQRLKSQTFPPSKILIVDNDPEQSAMSIANDFKDQNVSYYPVGHNSGPAGASYYGLKVLYEEGWEWVLWVDDDDPPRFDNQLEKIFSIVELYKDPGNIGIIGAVGIRFDFLRTKTIRLNDSDLSGILEVDMIAGGHFPIINRRVIDIGILPNKDIFFGFEDLEFCLRVKKAGFKILISGEELMRNRVRANRIGYSRPAYKKKRKSSLWREYYSVRTIVLILKFNEKAYIPLTYFFFRTAFKALFTFMYGWAYGSENTKYLLTGFWDGYKRKLGCRYMPKKKTN